MATKTRDELRQVLASTFGLAPIFDANQRHVDLVTSTGISIVQMDVLNRGTDDEPNWGIGGIAALGDIGGFDWHDLMRL